MNMIREFREFAMRGNVVDMAVGIIVGAAFGKMVSSVVGDLLMPPLGLLIGGVDFSDLVLTLKAAGENTPAVVLGYGRFIQALLDFTLIALAIFLLVKGINTLKRTQNAAPVPPPAPSREEQLLTEIRDLLRPR
ncbi:MAG: large-conductance mechanosensitive channel protein MscL [Nevskiales bacterium]|nr:large-conductance mechanosensitive channel protein MscL [Nevskiales bacterium]